MASQTFDELTHKEAKNAAQSCIRDEVTDNAIRQKLAKAGFNADAAAIGCHRQGNTVRVVLSAIGPKDEPIQVEATNKIPTD